MATTTPKNAVPAAPPAAPPQPVPVAESMAGLEAIERFLLPLTGPSSLGNLRSVMQLVQGAEDRVAIATKEAARLDAEAVTKRAELDRIGGELERHATEVARAKTRLEGEVQDARDAATKAKADMAAAVGLAETTSAKAQADAERAQREALDQLRVRRAAEERALAVPVEALRAEEIRLRASVAKLKGELEGIEGRVLAVTRPQG